MAESAAEGLFSQEFLRRLEGLRLLARRLARGPRKSERKSSHRGVSPEFAEYRAYVPGDDLRYLDWNAYARWRHLVLKLFVEERDLPVYLLLDCSASMEWGEPLKFDYARQLAAGLAYIALGNHDRVGLFPLGGEGNRGVPADRGKERFWQILRLLAGYEIQPGPARLYDEARRWLTFQPRRGFVLWISDLWGDDERDVFHALDRLRYSRHEVGVIQVFDAGESEAGPLGEYQLESVEGDARQPVLVDQAMRRQFREVFTGYQRSILGYCRGHQIPLLQTDTRLPVLDLLVRVLQEKGFVG